MSTVGEAVAARRPADVVATVGLLRVVDVPGYGRVEARTGAGEVVGRLEYERVGELLVLGHTEVRRELRGTGVGGRLALAAFGRARAAGRAVRVRCPFVRVWAAAHPDVAGPLTAGAEAPGH